jgi:hypothetical protein
MARQGQKSAIRMFHVYLALLSFNTKLRAEMMSQ